MHHSMHVGPRPHEPTSLPMLTFYTRLLGVMREADFKHGGWHLRYFENVALKWVVDNVSQAGGFLLGRRTYDMFAAHWPKAPDEEQALAVPLNTLPKYVASRTLEEPLRWQNSQLLRGEMAAAVAALKREGARTCLPSAARSWCTH